MTWCCLLTSLKRFSFELKTLKFNDMFSSFLSPNWFSCELSITRLIQQFAFLFDLDIKLPDILSLSYSNTFWGLFCHGTIFAENVLFGAHTICTKWYAICLVGRPWHNSGLPRRLSCDRQWNGMKASSLSLFEWSIIFNHLDFHEFVLILLWLQVCLFVCFGSYLTNIL